MNWKEGAERLGAALSLERLHPAVLRSVGDTPTGEPWLIACSGGADSVCLTLLLFHHFPNRTASMEVVHFNHRLRGEASGSDAEWVGELAKGLNLKLSLGHWNRGKGERVSEESARKARFEFFRRTLRQAKSRMLFFGHQRDDVAETLLMRLARGSGATGLAAPRPVQRHGNGLLHLRPLLDISKKEITDRLAMAGIPWREDESNATDFFLRNRLRNTVIPAWEKAFSRPLGQGAARSRELLEEDDAALESWLDALLGSEAPVSPMDLRPLAGKPAALLRRALHRFLIAHGVQTSLSRKAVERMLSRLREDRPFKVSAGNKRFIEFSKGRLHIKKEDNIYSWAALTVPREGAVFFPNGAWMELEATVLRENTRRDILEGRVSERERAYLKISPETMRKFVIRRWEPGDRYRPLGAPGRVKLQNLFTDRKIPAGERKQLPVVCRVDGEICWCPGLPPLDSLKIKADTVQALRLTYTPPSPAL